MAYSEELASGIRQALAPRADVMEKKMFGGLVVDDMLMLRLGNEGAAAALAEPHTKPMDFTGKPLKSMIYVAPQGIAALEDLIHWVNRGADFAATLPSKQAMELPRAYPFESAA